MQRWRAKQGEKNKQASRISFNIERLKHSTDRISARAVVRGGRRKFFKRCRSFPHTAPSFRRALVHSFGFATLAEALERYVSPAAAAIMRAPFVFGDSTDELRGLLTQAGFRTVRVGADVRMVRFESPEAFVRNQVQGSSLAAHVAAVDDTARERLIREVTAAMHAYMNDDGLTFPIEGQIAVARP